MNDGDDLQVFRQWMVLRTLAARRLGMSVAELAKGGLKTPISMVCVSRLNLVCDGKWISGTAPQ